MRILRSLPNCTVLLVLCPLALRPSNQPTMAAFVAVAPMPPVRSEVRCGLQPRRGAADRARDFLTQRSVQQVMFCARVLRDETTTRWLEAFLGHEGLDDLHHCDALRVPSDEYITQLLNEPPVTLNINKPIPGRTTNSNPYLKRRYFSYDVDIVPRTIGLRVLVRAHRMQERGRKRSALTLTNLRGSDKPNQMRLSNHRRRESK